MAKVGLTGSWGWGILLYHYRFIIITIIFIDIADAANGYTEIESE